MKNWCAPGGGVKKVCTANWSITNKMSRKLNYNEQEAYFREQAAMSMVTGAMSMVTWAIIRQSGLEKHSKFLRCNVRTENLISCALYALTGYCSNGSGVCNYKKIKLRCAQTSPDSDAKHETKHAGTQPAHNEVYPECSMNKWRVISINGTIRHYKQHYKQSQ